MKNTFNPNSERISRKAETLHWTAENTEAVHSFLAKNSLVSELYKDTRYMSVRLDNTIYHTLRHGDWIVKGEDLKIRFYDADKYALMYRPIDDELDRLRAFARFAIKHGENDLSLLSRAVRLGLLVPRECGLALDLAESLKVPEQLNNKGE